MNKPNQMDTSPESMPGAEPQPEQKLTREQRRIKERIEQEAHKTYQHIAGKFFQLFINSPDPEGPELEEKRKQMNAQWKMYCKRMQLLPHALLLFEDYAKGVIKEYQDSKNEVTV